MDCPSDIFDALRRLAEARGEAFNEEEVSVTTDSYQMVVWDHNTGELIYTPAMDPAVECDEDEEFEAWQHFIISKEDLERMSRDGDFRPALDRPCPCQD